jgi:hypothetical protein
VGTKVEGITMSDFAMAAILAVIGVLTWGLLVLSDKLLGGEK